MKGDRPGITAKKDDEVITIPEKQKKAESTEAKSTKE